MNNWRYLILSLLLIPALSRADSLEQLLLKKGIISDSEVNQLTEANAPKVYWKGGTHFDFPQDGFSSTISILLRDRYTFTNKENGPDSSSFELKTGRLYVSGSALEKQFDYTLMGDFVGRSENGQNSFALKDVFLAWKPTKQVNLKMGQWTTYVARQFNTSLAKLQFPDFAVATNYFLQGRQQGAAVEVQTEDKRGVARFGVFNGASKGEGEDRPGLDTAETLMASARYNFGAPIDAYEEGDVQFSETPGASVGIVYSYGRANQVPTDTDHIYNHTLNLDAVYKFHGFSLSGEYFLSSLNSQEAGSSTPSGFYVQSGYFIAPKLEAAARYSYLSCDSGPGSTGSCIGNDHLQETGVALNYYFWKNSLKATCAYSMIQQKSENGGPTTDTERYMFQLSAYF